MSQALAVTPGSNVDLSKYDPRFVFDEYDKEASKEKIAENAQLMADLCYRLYAEDRRSILLVLQGMDTAGKDGTIRHVMRGLNPQSCSVSSFKRPTEEELDHDFLWRIHKVAPRRGDIGIFNRSHYEDVLVVRVHNIVPPEQWEKRYELINSFEKSLSEAGTTIVKCFLHVSKDEQRERLQARLDDPSKLWKFSKGDLGERKLWDNYIEAYEAALTRCSTDHAPWHIIPSDRKWNRNLTVSNLLLKTMQDMDPQFPPAEGGLADVTVE